MESPRSSRHWADKGAGPGALAVKSLLREPAGLGLARKAACRAGRRRIGLTLGNRCPVPSPGRQRGARVPSTEGPRRASGRRCQGALRGRGRHSRPGSGRGLGGARGTEAAAPNPCRTRAARRPGPPMCARQRAPRRQGSAPAAGPRSGAGRAGPSAAAVAAAERAGSRARGGQLPSFRNCAWITKTRKQQSAAPASAQSAFRSCIAECPLGRRPPSRAAEVQAPHQRPAGCSRRGRPLAPSIRANAALRRDWRRRSGSRAVSFWAGGGERAGARGGGGWGGEVSAEARAAAAAAPAAAPAARPPSRAAGRRGLGRRGAAAAAP